MFSKNAPINNNQEIKLKEENENLKKKVNDLNSHIKIE